MTLKNKPVWRGRTGPAQPWVAVMLAQVLAVITDKVHPLQSVAAHDQTSDWLAHSGINIDKIFLHTASHVISDRLFLQALMYAPVSTCAYPLKCACAAAHHCCMHLFQPVHTLLDVRV